MRRRRAVSIALCLVVASGAIASARAGAAADKEAPSADGRLTPEEVNQLKNTVPFSKASIARGRNLFIRECTECHGRDGKSKVDVIANATDLTQPKLWTSGTSEGEIFRSIRDGAGDSMPPFKAEIENEEDIWHLVNFTRSLWPAAMRPKLQESDTN